MGTRRPTALTGGFQWAFWVCGAIALLAIPVTFLLIRREAAAPATAFEAAPATGS